MKEVYGSHNHEPDHTLLSNEIIHFIDDLVTGRGCNITTMEILNISRARFAREFDIPSFFHHISQRFDIVHKSDNIEFFKEFIREFD